MQKFIDWVNEGKRTVQIEIKNNSDIKVWCYDYDLMAGKYVNLHENPPPIKELKERELNYLTNKLEKLQGELVC